MTKYQAVNEVVDRQRTILVGVHLPERFGAIGGGDADLGELGRLTDTAGGEVVGSVLQRRDRPDGATFLGKGKLAHRAPAGGRRRRRGPCRTRAGFRSGRSDRLSRPDPGA